MCTITFIPKKNDDFILTSNRDEAPGRETFMPQMFEEQGVHLLYPKDAEAGGTWIGTSSWKRAICLMNGGFVAHQRLANYKKSRGVVVKDFLKAEMLPETIKNYDFNGIEPFTAVIVSWKLELQLFQLVWDGVAYHFSEEPLAPQIWSSSPLYPEPLKKTRVQWFSEFLFDKITPSETEILQFHKSAGRGDLNNGLIMDRGFIKTKSITQLFKNRDAVEMYYEDLQTEKTTKTLFKGF